MTLRKLLLLQAASFVPLFREAMKARGKVGDAKIDDLHPAEQDENPSVVDVFATLTKDRMAAARLAMSVQKQQPAGAKATDRRRPPAHLPQGHRFARLQVQLGGAGRYGRDFARVARSLPRREPLLDEGFGRAGVRCRQANAGGAELILVNDESIRSAKRIGRSPAIDGEDGSTGAKATHAKHGKAWEVSFEALTDDHHSAIGLESSDATFVGAHGAHSVHFDVKPMAREFMAQNADSMFRHERGGIEPRPGAEEGRWNQERVVVSRIQHGRKGDRLGVSCTDPGNQSNPDDWLVDAQSDFDSIEYDDAFFLDKWNAGEVERHGRATGW